MAPKAKKKKPAKKRPAEKKNSAFAEKAPAENPPTEAGAASASASALAAVAGDEISHRHLLTLNSGISNRLKTDLVSESSLCNTLNVESAPNGKILVEDPCHKGWY